MGCRAVIPPSSQLRWFSSPARRSRRCAGSPVLTPSLVSSKRRRTCLLRSTPTGSCPRLSPTADRQIIPFILGFLPARGVHSGGSGDRQEVRRVGVIVE